MNNYDYKNGGCLMQLVGIILLLFLLLFYSCGASRTNIKEEKDWHDSELVQVSEVDSAFTMSQVNVSDSVVCSIDSVGMAAGTIKELIEEDIDSVGNVHRVILRWSDYVKVNTTHIDARKEHKQDSTAMNADVQRNDSVVSHETIRHEKNNKVIQEKPKRTFWQSVQQYIGQIVIGGIILLLSFFVCKDLWRYVVGK